MTALAGRTAVVSGASRGIGLEISRRLVGDGARVAMLARTERDLRARAADLGPLALPIACDVTNADVVQAAVQRVTAEFGGSPDVLVNNAGTFILAPIERTDPEDFRRTLDVNLVAPFRLVHAFVGAMKTRGHGHIVTIGSIADHVAFPENGAYAASKFGLRALHEVLGAELRGTGIRVTLISPAPVDTSLWDEVNPDVRPGFAPRSAMLTPAAVAEAVHFALAQPRDVTVDEVRLSHS
jgi:NADP-dependent 3-hydroxy acid dehydrogenase YdfG